MKAMVILLIIGAFLLGIYNGDCTAAVVLTMLVLPSITARQNGRREK